MINDTDTESNIAEQERRNIEDLGSVETKNPRGNIHCLNIIGQVGDIWYCRRRIRQRNTNTFCRSL